MIRDVDNTSPLGVMVINLPQSAFTQAYSGIADDSSLQAIILNENNDIITPPVKPNENTRILQEILSENQDHLQQKLQQQSSGFLSCTTNNQRYLVSYLSGGPNAWRYISIMPYRALRTENTSALFFTFLVLLFDGVVFFTSSFLISRSTMTPIHQLLRSMQKAKRGKFEEVSVYPHSDEFDQLFNGYNTMIRQIQKLLQKIIQEQRTIRKAELNTLQAQIKPHFLYNTLDSIASLALSGENEQVCNLVEALGSYYRLSVSKGKEVITVGEEIDMVRNYLLIQKVRYQDLFEVVYQVDNSCLHYPILKLVLQPLVENSLYNGIRAKGTSGTISISVADCGDRVCLVVADDGIGMSAEQIHNILQQEKQNRGSSFGLWGTMERIRIFYGKDDCFEIESEPGEGTRISLRIPKVEGTEWNSLKY